MNRVDVLIIGGGISGLAVARLLVKEGVQIEVWECRNQPGGKIRTQTHQGYRLEQSASIVMNFRADVNRFLSECGLDICKTPLIPAAKRYLVHNGHLHPLPLKLIPMIASSLWTWQGRLRLAIEPFIPRGGHDDETVADFIRRRLGNEVLEKLMEPYVIGPLASDAERANASSTLPGLTALERRYGSLTLGMLAHRFLRRHTVPPREVFSFNNGMSVLTDTLAGTAGINFRSGCTAAALMPHDDGWRVYGRADNAEHAVQARQVVLSIPADAAASLTGLLDRELGELLGAIEYAPIAVVHTGFDRNAITHPLDGNGFLTPANSGIPATGCLWMSSVLPLRAPRGKVLLTNYLGGARSPDAAAWDEAKSVNEVVKGLRPVLGIKGDPEMVYMHRHKRGLPLYHGSYKLRVRAILSRLDQLPGLHISANYLGGVSVRDRILCAHTTADRIMTTLKQTGSSVRGG